MNNAIYNFREPKNEPVLTYVPGSPERNKLIDELNDQYSKVVDIPLIIGGKEIHSSKTGKLVMPSEHGHILATYHIVREEEVELAIKVALDAKCEWMTLAWMERAAIMLKAAELISKKYRFLLNAATMVGQQPFGGSRASGTNDKAGSYLNLIRWVSPRTIKETLIPATDFRYPFM
jgi:1-pyrroline-5-carboxylate dehydrogenase